MNWHTYLPSSRADSCSILIDLWWHVRATVIWRLLRTYIAANHGCYGKLRYFIDN